MRRRQLCGGAHQLDSQCIGGVVELPVCMLGLSASSAQVGEKVQGDPVRMGRCALLKLSVKESWHAALIVVLVAAVVVAASALSGHSAVPGSYLTGKQVRRPWLGRKVEHRDVRPSHASSPTLLQAADDVVQHVSQSLNSSRGHDLNLRSQTCLVGPHVDVKLQGLVTLMSAI
jgi:hypothetical protein